MPTQHVPVATYRLQFNKDFGFQAARALVPYLHSLGVSDLYASPLLAARRGSTHGYDVTDPTRLNPELGTQEDFDALVSELESCGMGILLDIVPNHMAISSENRWWTDVLVNGPQSAFATYFDIDWRYPKRALQGKVLLPVLGAPYGTVIENGELRVLMERDGFCIQYGEVRLPVALKSYARILRMRIESAAAGSGDEAFVQLRNLSRETGPVSATSNEFSAVGGGERALSGTATATDYHQGRDPQRSAARVDAGVTGSPNVQNPATAGPKTARDAIDRRLWELYTKNEAIRSFIDENLRILNGSPGDPASFEPLDQLLDEQAYWLCFWRLADEEINYRRFFTISDLICLRVEDPSVFEATHTLVLKLAKAGKVRGLRVDHIDGLHDPLGYLEELRAHLEQRDDSGERGSSNSPYLIVEKILAADESLPGDWPVAGTTGYDCLNAITGLFVDAKGIDALSRTYASFTGSKAAFRDVAYGGKQLVMKTLFGGEMRSLGYQVSGLAEQDRHVRDLPRRELERALVEVTACFPVYRTYIRGFEISARNRRCIEWALHEAQTRNLSVSKQVFDFLRSVLLLESPSYLAEEQRQAWLRFVMRWQQFTGPIMAKGVEDTALYVYNRLVSANEVGGAPESPAVPVPEFHTRMAARFQRWPHTLNATATHDTKRGEDVRARINVLSEIPSRWDKKVGFWSRWNRQYVQMIDGRPVPDRNEEYLLYQTLLGAWPFQENEINEFGDRVASYAIKAAREAKVNTRWTLPDIKREKALVRFIHTVMKRAPENRFLEDFLEFQREIAFYGALNGLSQVLLKMTAPGVPDFYQGTELWDLTLVDPDNRRPIDFRRRMELLKEMAAQANRSLDPLLQQMLTNWEDGRLKLFLIWKSLAFRRANPEFFRDSNYVPLETAGERADHICAFARHARAKWLVTIVPRVVSGLVAPGQFPMGASIWTNSTVRLPEGSPTNWRNELSGEHVQAQLSGRHGRMLIGEAFQRLPLALLSSAPETRANSESLQAVEY